MLPQFMQIALEQARSALDFGELPIGAVVIRNNQVIGQGFNRTFLDKDPTAHAEIVAIRQAANALGDWRLSGCDIYITLEPCPMCVGAILLARIEKIHFAAFDPKDGACGSKINLAEQYFFGHCAKVIKTEGSEESLELVREFFQRKRGKI